MRTKLISTASVDEPITIAEARQHLNYPDENVESSQILFWIQAAKEQTEHKLGRKLMAQTWDAYLDEFPSTEEIELPFAPLASVSSISYYDVNDTLQVVPSSDYSIDTSGVLGRIVLAYNASWPTVATSLANAVTIRFVTGYPSADAIPQSIRHYMKLLISEMMANRELTTEREIFLTPWAERLLDPYRVHFIV